MSYVTHVLCLVLLLSCGNEFSRDPRWIKITYYKNTICNPAGGHALAVTRLTLTHMAIVFVSMGGEIL